MFHNLTVPEKCLSLWKTCRSLVPELLKNSHVKSSNLLIKSNSPIDPQSGSVYLIKEGTINETYEGQIVVIHEKGDLIGIDGLSKQKVTSYENDFAVKVDEYDGQQLLNEIFNDKNKFMLLNQYLSCLSQGYQLLTSHLTHQDATFSPEYRCYDKGDIIIKENTEGDEVFTLLSGSAKVMINNTEVGEINQDEIFGAIAAITHTKRTASIIATSNCETIIVKSDSFRGLLSAHPETVEKLVKDMARSIVSSNERVIELSKNQSD
ncbi:MAG: cyclic nucleotide-binding domain-containing protein [Gammaproteobacteria bacterium]|nr:cyclic nucleotide-binding domain-containing protein [Gammaproteobacteria bacterium]